MDTFHISGINESECYTLDAELKKAGIKFESNGGYMEYDLTGGIEEEDDGFSSLTGEYFQADFYFEDGFSYAQAQLILQKIRGKL